MPKNIEFKVNDSWNDKDPVAELGLTLDETVIMELADEMASAMSDLNPQNYKTFVDARERFRDKIKQMVRKQKVSEERIAKIKETVLSI